MGIVIRGKLKGMGRTLYTPELADHICEKLMAGESLNAICKPDDFPVTEAAVRNWVANDLGGFASKYAHARNIGLDHKADELEAVARTEPDVNRARLIVDTLKWQLSKMAPKRYGDRMAFEHSGELALTKRLIGVNVEDI